MSPEARQAIVDALWPEGSASRLSVWGVLDCARDPAIYAALLESRLEFRCLYSGRLPRLLEMNAPQLVEVLPSNRLMHRWLDEGWGRAWGVFVRVEDPSNLRHHLRKLLKVQAPDGRRLLFRFYDPRVMHRFLPTCDRDQLRTVFGPIASWVFEADWGGTLVSCALAGQGLQTKRQAIETASAPQP